MSSEVFDDLEAEQAALDSVLSALPAEAWASPSAAAGWTVADVVLHLAQTEEAVVASAAGTATGSIGWQRYGDDVDSAMDALVRAERADGPAVFERWRAARRAALSALRAADPRQPLRWVTASLKPRTLATTRLAEHWAHALDVTVALGIEYPDTVRLRHVAWLGHGTLPYAFRMAGEEVHDVFCALVAPDGASWEFGPADADSTITGDAGAFCRVGARRLTPSESGLATTGPHAATALRLLRNYAVA